MGAGAGAETGAAGAGTAAMIERLQAAAEDDHPESMFLLGAAYAQGRGVARSDGLAARWFHRAARRGHLRAQTSIGYLYASGRGVRREPVLAHVFLARAAEQGDPLARDLLARLRPTMSLQQIDEAGQRLREGGP